MDVWRQPITGGDTMEWHDALEALDKARRAERNAGFTLESQLATIDVEIVERQAFQRHLRNRWAQKQALIAARAAQNA
jgi:hypothetical protein